MIYESTRTLGKQSLPRYVLSTSALCHFRFNMVSCDMFEPSHFHCSRIFAESVASASTGKIILPSVVPTDEITRGDLSRTRSPPPCGCGRPLIQYCLLARECKVYRR